MHNTILSQNNKIWRESKLKTIYKYTLEGKESNVIEMPLSTQIISVESQGDNIVVYGIVDTEENATISYDFRTYGTGLQINIDLNEYKFLSTVKLYNGSLMFHVFYKQFGA